jgi:hypothetical protein
MRRDPQELTIVSLTHDLQNKRSLALITWDGIPDRRLSVPVPFNTKIDELLPAAQTALRELQAELESTRLKVADDPTKN